MDWLVYSTCLNDGDDASEVAIESATTSKYSGLVAPSWLHAHGVLSPRFVLYSLGDSRWQHAYSILGSWDTGVAIVWLTVRLETVRLEPVAFVFGLEAVL